MVIGLATFFILKDNKKADDSSILPSEEISVTEISDDDCVSTLQRVLEEKDNLLVGDSVVYALWGNDEHNMIIGITQNKVFTQKTNQYHHLHKIVKNDGKWIVEYTGVSECDEGVNCNFDTDKMKASRDIIPQIVEIDEKKYFFYAYMLTGPNNKESVKFEMIDIENMKEAATATYAGTLQDKNGEQVIECSPASGSGNLVKWMNETAKNSIGIINFKEKKAEQPAPVKKVENKNNNKNTINTGNDIKNNNVGKIKKENENGSVVPQGNNNSRTPHEKIIDIRDERRGERK